MRIAEWVGFYCASVGLVLLLAWLDNRRKYPKGMERDMTGRIRYHVMIMVTMVGCAIGVGIWAAIVDVAKLS